jgi:hypothetical protein
MVFKNVFGKMSNYLKIPKFAWKVDNFENL